MTTTADHAPEPGFTPSLAVPPPATTASTGRSSRIVGLDLARAIAMFGMVIAHYAWSDGSGGVLDGIAGAADGRAMPLFVMLGGVGAVLLTDRAANPDRSLLIRAAILAPMGLALQEATTFIAIILHYYSVFFVAAALLRRLPSRVLGVLAVVVTMVGGWSYQALASAYDGYREPWDLIDSPLTLPWSVMVEGYYPFFPVAAFFIVGMMLARTDLRSTTVAVRLLAIGTAVSTLVFFGADWLVSALNINAGQWLLSDDFLASRLLDDDGHSEMPAWVIGAAGSSVAIIGLSLLIAGRIGRWLRPLVSLGQLALTFYVFQAVLVRFITHPDQTGLAREFVNVVVIYLGFMVFATAWKWRFRSGPLEALLRLGSSRRTVAAPVSQAPKSAVDVPHHRS